MKSLAWRSGSFGPFVMCFLGGNPLYMCHNDKMYTNYMEYVLLYLRWENILRGVVRQRIAQFCVAFSCICFLSHHVSKCFIQKVVSYFIFLYLSCCWDFSGTSVHTWSISQFPYLFIAAAIFWEVCWQLLIAMHYIFLYLDLPSFVPSPLFGNCLTHTKILSSLYLPYQFAVTLCKCLWFCCDFIIFSFVFS